MSLAGCGGASAALPWAQTSTANVQATALSCRPDNKQRKPQRWDRKRQAPRWAGGSQRARLGAGSEMGCVGGSHSGALAATAWMLTLLKIDRTRSFGKTIHLGRYDWRRLTHLRSAWAHFRSARRTCCQSRCWQRQQFPRVWVSLAPSGAYCRRGDSRVDRTIAVRPALRGAKGRKVRAPQDRVVGNAHRPQGPGKCNRKQTATRQHCWRR